MWDDGRGLDPRATPNTATGRELVEGGTGLLLMQALVDRLDFRHDPDGRHRVTLEKQFTSRPTLRLLDQPQ